MLLFRIRFFFAFMTSRRSICKLYWMQLLKLALALANAPQHRLHDSFEWACPLFPLFPPRPAPATWLATAGEINKYYDYVNGKPHKCLIAGPFGMTNSQTTDRQTDRPNDRQRRRTPFNCTAYPLLPALPLLPFCFSANKQKELKVQDKIVVHVQCYNVSCLGWHPSPALSIFP